MAFSQAAKGALPDEAPTFWMISLRRCQDRKGMSAFRSEADVGSKRDIWRQPRYISKLSNDKNERWRVWTGEPIGPPCPLAPTSVYAKKACTKAEADFVTWLMMAKLGGFDDL